METFKSTNLLEIDTVATCNFRSNLLGAITAWTLQYWRQYCEEQNIWFDCKNVLNAWLLIRWGPSYTIPHYYCTGLHFISDTRFIVTRHCNNPARSTEQKWLCFGSDMKSDPVSCNWGLKTLKNSRHLENLPLYPSIRLATTQFVTFVLNFSIIKWPCVILAMHFGKVYMLPFFL